MRITKFCGILFLMLSLVILGCGGGSSKTGQKEAADNELQGVWYSIEKEKKSGVVSSINILEIKDLKSAHLTKWDLKGNTFSGANGTYTKLLWQSTDIDLAISKSGRTLTFTVPEVKEMGDILECTYDSDKAELKSKEGGNTFSKKELSVQKIKDDNIKMYQDFVAKQGINAEIENDMTNSEYMEYVKNNTFGQ